jgi:predicted DNA-binding protein (MmcQ/YjbR family)
VQTYVLHWKKMFCVTGLEQVPVGITVKVNDEDFEKIINRAGFQPAPYLARYRWVLLDDVNKVSKKEKQQLIRQSYELIKGKVPKKLLK